MQELYAGEEEVAVSAIYALFDQGYAAVHLDQKPLRPMTLRFALPVIEANAR